MTKLVAFCCLIFSCSTSKETVQEKQIVTDINRAYVLSSFARAGTTASIKTTYAEMQNNQTNKRILSGDRLDKLKNVLEVKKWDKHRQKKIAEIDRAIELCNPNNCFCFILTTSQLIDITRGYECNLLKGEYQELSKIFE